MVDTIYYVLNIPSLDITEKQYEILNNIFKDKKNLSKAAMINSIDLKTEYPKEYKYLCILDGQYKFDLWYTNKSYPIDNIQKEDESEVIFLNFNNFKKKLFDKIPNKEKYKTNYK